MRHPLFVRRLMLAAVLVLAILAGTSRDAAAGAPAGAERLVILFTHDLHSYFLPRRIATPGGTPTEQGGYAKLQTLNREIRAREGDRVLLVDAGDFSMGTLFHAAFMTEAAELRLMTSLGYDVMTLGNHDFDFHLDGLARTLQAARAAEARRPVMVASNVVFGADGQRDKNLREAFRDYPVLPYTVIERRGLRIGLFGILGKDAQVDTPFAKPVTFADPVETSRNMVALLREKEGVDLVIALSHAGTAPEKTHSEDENLARTVAGIDVIISGHTHTVLPEPIAVGRTLIVSAGSYGAYLGRLDIDVSRQEGVRAAGYTLIPVTPEIPDDPPLAALIAAFQRDVNEGYLADYGYRYDQVIAESAFDLETLQDAYADPKETGIGNLITDAYRHALRRAEGERYDHVHVAVQPLGLIRDSFLKGPIAVADVFRVLSLGLGFDGRPGYPLVSYYLTGRELKDLLEVETTVAKIKRDAHLQLAGVRFSFNPWRVPFDRVTAIRVENAAGGWETVVPDQLYRVCLNFYTARMVDYVRTASHGLLSITPRDRQGRPVADTRQGVIVDADPVVPGNQELKEWIALAAYLQGFPDIDGNGIPDMPGRYRQPEGRFGAAPSLNPIDLLAGGNIITWAAVAIGLLLLVLLVGLVWFALRLVRRRLRSVA